MRYGVDLDKANPELILRESRTPVRAAHPRAGRRLHVANPKFMEWEIEGRITIDAWHRAGREFERRVIA